MNTIENKHRKYLLGKSEQMFVQCTRYSFIMDLTSYDKYCCYTMNSTAVLWFFKGIIHPKMKFIIIHYLLSCCSKTFIYLFIYIYLFIFLTCSTQMVLSTQYFPSCSFLYNESEWWKCYFFQRILFIFKQYFHGHTSSDQNKNILFGFRRLQVSYMGYFIIFKLESTCPSFTFTVCNIKAQTFCSIYPLLFHGKKSMSKWWKNLLFGWKFKEEHLPVLIKSLQGYLCYKREEKMSERQKGFCY